MRGIELFRNVSIGRYIDTGSHVHAQRPATKYLWLLALMVAGIASSSYAGAFLPFALALVLGAIAGIRPSFFLRGMKPLLPLLLLIALLQFLFAWPGDTSRVLVILGPFSATAKEARLAVMTLIRTFSLMTVVGLFTAVTSEGESVHGIEDLLAPFSRFGLRPQRLALAVGVALRFVPIIVGELESIAKAQASRGADFGSGRGGPIAKARAYLPLFVPVTVRALERAELMAEAMEARGYAEDSPSMRRTRLVSYSKPRGEALVRGAAIAACAASFALDYVVDRYFKGV
jgi:energy-coupling factor transport system permease protein